MLEPFLHSLKMVIRRKVEPFVANIAQKSFWVKFANIGILREQSIPLIQGVNILVIANKRRESQSKLCKFGDSENTFSWLGNSFGERPKESNNKLNSAVSVSICHRKHRVHDRPQTGQHKGRNVGTRFAPPRYVLPFVALQEVEQEPPLQSRR